MQHRAEQCASAVQRKGKMEEGAVQQDKSLCSARSWEGDQAATGSANRGTKCLFSTPAPTTINPPQRKEDAEAQKK